MPYMISKKNRMSTFFCPLDKSYIDFFLLKQGNPALRVQAREGAQELIRGENRLVLGIYVLIAPHINDSIIS